MSRISGLPHSFKSVLRHHCVMAQEPIDSAAALHLINATLRQAVKRIARGFTRDIQTQDRRKATLVCIDTQIALL